MKSFLSKLRLKWFLATRALGHGVDFTDVLYRTYLNHDKIIHFRRGHPVYSLMTPALFTKPAAHFISRAMYRLIQNKNLPNLMSFAVNDQCNAECEHCSFFEGVAEPGRHVLTLDEGKRLLADAQDLGVSVINFVGGEPLMHEELPQLIDAVDKRRATTLVYTNGWALEDRATELKRAGLDSIFTSIQSADAATHDRFCHAPGLFDRAMRGVRKARKLGFSVGLAASLTREAWEDGELDRIVELARELRVHEVFVFDVVPSGRYADRTDLLDDHDWTERMVQSARRYNDNPRDPGVTFHAYMSSHRSLGCACGTSYFYVSPYGDMMSCDFNHARFGNVLAEPLWKVWERLSTSPDFCRAKWGGCKIMDPELRKTGVVRLGLPETENA